MGQQTSLSEVVDSLSEDPTLRSSVLRNRISEIMRSADENTLAKIIDLFAQTGDYEGLYDVWLKADGKIDFVRQRFSQLGHVIQREIAVNFLSGRYVERFGLEFAVLTGDDNLIATSALSVMKDRPIGALQTIVRSEDYRTAADIFVYAMGKVNVRPGDNCVVVFIKQHSKDPKGGTDWKGPVEALYNILGQMKNPHTALTEVTRRLLDDARSDPHKRYRNALEAAFRAKDIKLILDVSLQAARRDYTTAFEGFNTLLTKYKTEPEVKVTILNGMREIIDPMLDKDGYGEKTVETALEAARLTGHYKPINDHFYIMLQRGEIDSAVAVKSSIPSFEVDDEKVIGIANATLDKVELKVDRYRDPYYSRGLIERAIKIAELSARTLYREKLSQAIVRAMPYDRDGVMIGLKYLTEKKMATNAQQKLYQAMQQGLI